MRGDPGLVYLLRHYPQLSQTFVRNEIAGLRALGHDVHVISLKVSDTEHVDPEWAGPYERWPAVDVRGGLSALAWWVLHHPLRTARMLAAARAMGFSDRRRLALLEVPVVARRLVAEGPVSAVHTHFAWPVSLEPTVLLARLLGARSSVTTHARDIYLPAPVLPVLLRSVDAMVTVCRYNVAEMERTGLWTAERPSPVIVPCGVEVPGPVPRPASERRHRVVSVGRLVEKKGFGDLLAAMPEVVRQVPGAHLEIIGDGPLRDVLEQQVVDLGLTTSVTLRGAVPHAEVLEAIACADVFALACRVDFNGDSDAMPVVLREAMARAVPVVTTDVGGIAESVDPGCGWLVPPQNPSVLALAIRDALAQPDEAERRARAGKERVMGAASASGSARSMVDVLVPGGASEADSTTVPQKSPDGTNGHRYSVVTVFYEGDLPLLHLQARSLARHTAHDLFEAVVVIDNTRQGLSDRGVRRLVDDYGSLAPLVRVVRAASLVILPPMTGWWSQQVLKLVVAQTITTDRYLVLDAKNIFVTSLDLQFLQAPGGRARLLPSTFVNHPLRPKLEATLRYLGVDPARWLEGFGSTVTPFVMETAVVRDLVKAIERRSGRSLAQEMIAHGLTEFFLYQGWIVAGGRDLDEVHAMDRPRCSAVWPSRADLAMLRREIAEFYANRPPVFTVHQKAIAGFDAKCIKTLADFWVECGVFPTVGAARSFLYALQRRWWWRRRMRTAGRLLAVPVHPIMRGARLLRGRGSGSGLTSPRTSRT